MSDEIKKTGEDVDNNIDRILEERRKSAAENAAGQKQQYRAVFQPDLKNPASNGKTASDVKPGTRYRNAQPIEQKRDAVPQIPKSQAPGSVCRTKNGMPSKRPADGRTQSGTPVSRTASAAERAQNGVPVAHIANTGERARPYVPKSTSKKYRDDDDIKIAVSGKHSRNGDGEKTRKTDIEGRIKTPPKKKKEDINENDIGGSLVVSMLRAVVYLVVVSVIAAVLSIAVINVGNDVYAFVKNDDSIDVTIPEGATREDIAEILYENGVIKYKSVFKLYGSIKHIEDNFVAGDYTVTPMMNYKSLYNEFKEKPVSGTSWITIPEGYTTDEIIDLMLSYDIGGTKEDYVKAINEDEYDYWFVKELDDAKVMENGERFYKLDGYLFPDTYEFYNASSAHTVINKMLQRFDEVYTDVFKQRAKEVGFTTDQAVILASIIEKEAGHSSDFRNVSSVFHNRLNNSATFPRFESDATAVYAVTHITGERPEEVTHETISYDSPYNTYLYNSFPPGPIANPGLNALKYSVFPAETNYYFFVSSSSGTTLFATSKWEHDQNVASLKK